MVRPLWNTLLQQRKDSSCSSPTAPSTSQLPPPCSPIYDALPNMHVGGLTERYGECFRVIGKGTGGVVRLFRKPEGSIYAVKEFRRRRSNEAIRHYAESLTREYCIGKHFSSLSYSPKCD
jgi:hypothetical protein